MKDKIQETIQYLKTRVRSNPLLAVILGTGLNDLAEAGTVIAEFPYGNIPGFARSTAPSHKGRMVFSCIDGQDVLFLQGRLHYYEGYPMTQITYPIRVIEALGIKNLVITNAAGSLNEAMSPGSIVLLKDHINLMGTNPLIGPPEMIPGERFPSLHEPYNQEMIAKAIDIAEKNKINIHQGVYVAVSGPSLETAAECRMLSRLGADLVGMSTVPEVIVGVQCGLKILGISIVTNYGNIFHTRSHSQEEIREHAAKAADNLETLIRGLISRTDTKKVIS